MDRPDSPVSSNNCLNVSGMIQSKGQYNNKINNELSQQQQQTKNRVCRDFVRGSCRRLYCKYPHVQSPDLVVFCHDYQNNKCPRANCKFLHYSISDEEHYRKYGEFPIEMKNNDDMHGNNLKNNSDYQNDYDFKNFFKGSNNSNSNRTIPSLLDGVGDLFHSCQSRVDSCSMHCQDRGYSNGNSVFRNGLKRLGSQDRDCMTKYKRCSNEDDIMSVLRRFDEEHSSLKRRVEANELKIAELRASNEYLLTQNAHLRLSTVQVSQVVNPVTVTNTQSQQGLNQRPQVINATMTPIQVTTPIVSMATPQTQIIATPPNQMNGTSIAIASNANQSTQQILGNQITLAPAALAPSISTPINTISINTSQALQAAISNATQPIISYPIMTHTIMPPH